MSAQGGRARRAERQVEAAERKAARAARGDEAQLLALCRIGGLGAHRERARLIERIAVRDRVERGDL